MGPLPIDSRQSARRLILLLAIAAALLLTAAAPALAADGVRVIPSPVASPDRGQSQPDISGDILAYVSSDPANSDDAVIALKWLGDANLPTFLPRPALYKDAEPTILVHEDTISVVWTRMALFDPWDSDLWIWEGTFGAPTGGFVATNASFPKPLVTGPEGGLPSTQSAPSLGLAKTPGGDHVVLAWQDTRDNGTEAPLVYSMDLSADTSYENDDWVSSGGAAAAGTPVDATGVLARGQTSPEVGSRGIFWLDDRWSFWDDGLLTDTAVWRADLNADPVTVGPFHSDLVHTYDNGVGGGPKATWNGAAWMRNGPYGGRYTELPYVQPVGGSGHALSPVIRPNAPDTFTRASATTTGLVVAGAHLNRTDAIDQDIFFFDAASGARVPVCDRGNPAGSDADSTPGYFRYDQSDPAIGPAPGGYRVVWVDRRDAPPGAGEDTPEANLYEAFVPSVSARLHVTSALDSVIVKVTGTVTPSFAGSKVFLERVKPIRVNGATVYQLVKRLPSALLKESPSLPGGNDSASMATLTWKTSVKGTYYFRVFFPGGSRYTYDGSTPAKGDAVPHVGNVSGVIKVRVK